MARFGTNIRVTRDTYRYIEQRKSDDESFNDALQRELGLANPE